MKKYAPAYYLLFVMLIMGAFASMAQNGYGMKMVGIVAFAFAVMFAIQFAAEVRNGKETTGMAASIALVILSVVMGMRVFYLRFPYVEIVFAAAGVVLIVVYAIKLMDAFKRSSSESTPWRSAVGIFYGSVISYTISLTAVPFAPVAANAAGAVGFVLLVTFLIAAFLTQKATVNTDNISVFRYVTRLNDRSFVLLSLFFLFTLYIGFTGMKVLPSMYADEFPQAYYELIKEAEAGETASGRHEEFKEKYDRFIDHNKK